MRRLTRLAMLDLKEPPFQGPVMLRAAVSQWPHHNRISLKLSRMGVCPSTHRCARGSHRYLILSRVGPPAHLTRDRSAPDQHHPVLPEERRPRKVQHARHVLGRNSAQHRIALRSLHCYQNTGSLLQLMRRGSPCPLVCLRPCERRT
jgi:hypothetical protein